MPKSKILTRIILISVLLPLFIKAQEELGLYEHLNQYIPNNLVFINDQFDTVNLLKQIDKPTVIVPVYYECEDLCPTMLEGVADVISKAPMVLGKDYQVFTVSFDPGDKPDIARIKKQIYTKLLKSGIDGKNGWMFYTGDSTNIDNLLNSLGYKVKRDGKEWIHPSAVIVLSPQGKITRYLYGTYFLPFDLKMAIVEASQGRSGPTINKLLKFCFSYDPKSKAYVLNITRVSGSIIFLLVAGFFITLVIKGRKVKKPSKDN